ncbi:hypothetical protein LAZ67_5002809 [Cordylochernes scorpioides]|uniref:Uncharacterized protein n=1 Tax=Cordylochernes scorpioides TaxID=51811 RepID=A0ABY6KHS8_9ARAC|nr:hypothetical protein LAZ67_5002809 [Cordylochernes scorpioides]
MEFCSDISPPSRIDWASLRRCAFSGHEADAALKLALHALPHPASDGPAYPACGSIDRSLGHRYWCCRSMGSTNQTHRRLREFMARDRTGVTLMHCSMAYWLKVITALLIIGCIELNPGPKRQATLTNMPHSTPDQAPMDDLKLLIINLSAEVNRLGEKMDARLLNIEQ